LTNQNKKVRQRVQHSCVKYSFFSTSINKFASGLPSSRYLPGKIRLRIIEIYGFLFNFLINFQVILFLSIKRERKVIPIVCVNKDEVGVRSKGIIDKGKS